MRIYITLVFLAHTYLCASGQIGFREVGEEMGVIHSFDVWTVGGGLSVYDFTQDGLDDLTFSSTAGAQVAFYRNTGSGFERIAPLVNNTETIKQILWADYDNDGDPDLYLSAFDGISRLYENNGDLSLADVTEQVGLPIEVRRGYGACWADVNRDGWLDLYYVSRDLPGETDFKNLNRLFISNADGTFSDQTYELNASDEGKIPFCAAFVDYNNDMWPDIYIANDRFTSNTLLKNNASAGFEDVSEPSGTALKMNAMCVTFGDYNSDGWLDIYITNTEEGNKFLINTGAEKSAGSPDFLEKAEELGLAFNGIGWGSNFLDADNDGDLDLYVSGSIHGSQKVSSRFYENLGDDQFVEVVGGDFIKDTVASFGNAIGDWNLDGRIDIAVQNNPPDPFHLWENRVRNENKYIKLSLKGILSNREGIGARIELYADGKYQLHYTHSGFGYLGQNSSPVHFGVGNVNQVDSVSVTWPSGHIDRFYGLTTNTTHLLKEGESTGGEISVAPDVTIVNRSISTPTDDLESNNTVAIFPNPSHMDLSLISSQSIESIHVYNHLGQLVVKKTTNGIYQTTLDIRELTRGAYMVEIRGQKFRSIQKFIKL